MEGVTVELTIRLPAAALELPARITTGVFAATVSTYLIPDTGHWSIVGGISSVEQITKILMTDKRFHLDWSANLCKSHYGVSK